MTPRQPLESVADIPPPLHGGAERQDPLAQGDVQGVQPVRVGVHPHPELGGGEGTVGEGQRQLLANRGAGVEPGDRARGGTLRKTRESQ